MDPPGDRPLPRMEAAKAAAEWALRRARAGHQANAAPEPGYEVP